MKTEVLIVLGAPNSITGKLSKISRSRLDCCADLYSEGIAVLCTGGWGAHFNTSKNAHAFYAKNYLLKKGVEGEDFLEFALSENTVDDAVKAKAILSELGYEQITVISSDYHIERVKLIFNEILEEFQLKYIGVKSPLSKKELHSLVLHEQKAIKSIKKSGLYY